MAAHPIPLQDKVETLFRNRNIDPSMIAPLMSVVNDHYLDYVDVKTFLSGFGVSLNDFLELMTPRHKPAFLAAVQSTRV